MLFHTRVGKGMNQTFVTGLMGHSGMKNERNVLPEKVDDEEHQGNDAESQADVAGPSLIDPVGLRLAHVYKYHIVLLQVIVRRVENIRPG